MPTTFCNDARSKVAAGGGRSIGGTSITVEDGSKYQGTTGSAPSVGSPAKLTIIRWTSSTDYIVVVVLLCTGRAGNVLTIAGAAEGYSDAAVLAGDYVMVGPTAGDLETLQAAIATNAAAIAGKQDALGAGAVSTSMLADSGVTTVKIAPNAVTFAKIQAAASAGVIGASTAGNYGHLTIGAGLSITAGVLACTVSGGGAPGGSSGQLQYNGSGSFAGDSALVFDATNKRLGVGAATPASTLDVQQYGSEAVLNLRSAAGSILSTFNAGGHGFPVVVRFILGRYVDLAAGTSLTAKAIADFAGTIAKVKVVAGTNPSGGGFSFQINKSGSPIFASSQTIAASTTTVQSFTSFSSTSVAEGDTFTVDVSSPGTGVQDVVIDLTILVRNT